MVLALVLAACGGGTDGNGAADDGQASPGDQTEDATPTAAAGGEGPITIGSTLPLTSAVSDQAEQLRDGYELAMKEINADGGVLGRELELVVEDDQFDAARARELTRQLITEDDIVALLGSFGSAQSLTQSAEAESAGIPGIYPFASVAEMVERDFKNVFNLYPLSEAAEQAADNFLQDVVQPESVGILYVDNPFAISGAEASRETLEDAGISVPVFEKYALDTSDFTSLVTRAQEAGVDALKNIGYANHHVAYMQAISQTGFDAEAVYSETQIPFEQRAQEALGEAANLALGQPYWYRGATPDFEAAFEEEYGYAPEIQAVFGYSAMQVLADAIERAGSTDPEALRSALADTDLQTPMGTIRFDERGAYDRNFRIAQLQDGEVVIVWPEDEANGEFQPWVPVNER